MIKIDASINAKPLTQSINCYLNQGIFPGNAKIASAIPLDNGKCNKNDVLNYKPVGIWTLFLGLTKM